ncbi:hypothetical protein M3Y99_00866200 [Aphelenchoides fujianensis]|nr:hypothetical protein M3Y99_00866200 [Aphelenchoides fujianensis]
MIKFWIGDGPSDNEDKEGENSSEQNSSNEQQNEDVDTHHVLAWIYSRYYKIEDRSMLARSMSRETFRQLQAESVVNAANAYRQLLTDKSFFSWIYEQRTPPPQYFVETSSFLNRPS